jgi:hypothetical protein
MELNAYNFTQEDMQQIKSENEDKTFVDTFAPFIFQKKSLKLPGIQNCQFSF